MFHQRFDIFDIAISCLLQEVALCCITDLMSVRLQYYVCCM